MRSVLTPRLALLSLAHFTVDSYSSFFSPLLPLLVQKLDLSLTMVGTLVALASVSSSFSQPLFGWLSDRVRRPWFVAFGPLVAAGLLSCIGLASSYGTLVALLMLGGLGVAAFHPQGAAMASERTPRRGLAMAIFVSGGTLGFSLGPLFAVSVVSVFGLERTYLAAALGVGVTLVLLPWFARVRPVVLDARTRPRFSELRPVARPLIILYAATVMRSAVSYGFMTFLPLYLTGRGFSVAASGGVITAYLLMGAIGGFLGGWLADRWGGRRIVLWSFVTATPLYISFLFLPDATGLPMLILGSFMLQTSLPVNVVLGQELSPRHASTISSLLMGAAWGLGALLIGPIGALADARNLHDALLVLASFLGFGIVCAAVLPEARRQAQPVELGQPATAAALHPAGPSAP